MQHPIDAGRDLLDGPVAIDDGPAFGIGSGERADVLIVPSGAEGATVRLVGSRLPNPFNLSFGLPAEYPLAFFRIHGTSRDAPPVASTDDPAWNRVRQVAKKPYGVSPHPAGISWICPRSRGAAGRWRRA